MANEEYKDIGEQREKMREFKDHLGRPVTQETRERIMGICGDIDKFLIEKSILAAQLVQMRMEESELRDLREIRDGLAAMFRGGFYRLEKQQGLITDKSTSHVVMNYLLRERRRLWVRLRALFGVATW